MARNPYVTLDHVIGILDPTPVTQEVIDSIGSHFSPGVVDNGALAFHSPNLLTNFDSFEQYYGKTLLGSSGRIVDGIDIEEVDPPFTITKAGVINTRKFHGENSLEIECSVDNIGYKYINPYTSAATDWIVINEVGSYIFSYYIYTTANTAINGTVQLYSYAAAGTLGSASFDGVKQSNGWVRKFIKFTTTSPNTATIRININTPGATIYLDALQLEKSDGAYPSAFGPGGQTVISGGNITTNSIKANQLSSNFGEFANTLTVGTSPNVVVITGIAGGGEGARIYTGVGEFNNTNTPFFLGGTTGKFSLSNKLNFDGTNLSITGAITAASGSIAGWVIGTDEIYKGSGAGKIALNSGAIPKIYNGVGNHGSDTTGFYIDGDGKFSLKNQLIFSPGTGIGSQVVFNGTKTLNSTIISGISSTSGLYAGMTVTGEGIPSNSHIKTVGTNSITLDKAAVSSGTISITAIIDNLGQLEVVGKIRGAIEGNTYVPSPRLNASITNFVIASDIATITTMGHAFLTNERVLIEGMTATALNREFIITEVIDSVSFKVSTLGTGLNGVQSGTNRTAVLRELTMGLHPSEGVNSYYHDAGTGLRLDKYNWWFTNNQFRVGTSGAYLRWNGTTLDIQGGNSKKLKLGVGAANTDNYFAITTASTPNYSNTDTPFYVDGDGKFSLSDKLTWNGTTLNITGNLSINSTFATSTGSTNAQALLDDIAAKEATIYKQTTAPSHLNGRLWCDTSVTPNVWKRSDGSVWVKLTPTEASEVGAYSSSDGSALASRVSTAETKITPEAITSTVRSSTEYTNDLNSKVSTTYLTTNYSTIEQTSDKIALEIGKSGGQNFAKNGNFANGIQHYLYYYQSGGTWNVTTRNDYWTNFENALEILLSTTGAIGVLYTLLEGLTVGKTYTVGCLMAGHHAKNYLTVVNYADTAVIGATEMAIDKLGGPNLSDWALLKATFTATDATMRLRFNCEAINDNGFLWAKEVRCNEGTVLLPFQPNGKELYGAKYTFDGSNATFTGGGLIIKNNAGTTVFTADVDGNLDITGKITSDSGMIGGFTLGATRLSAGTTNATAVGIASGETVAFWAGHLTPGSAPFRVTRAGALTATSGAIGGWTINSTAGLTKGGVTLDATNERIYVGGAAYLYSYASGVIGISGQLRTTGNITSVGSVNAQGGFGVADGQTANLGNTVHVRFGGTKYLLTRDSSGFVKATTVITE